jgi:hypothetical protein
MTPHQRIRHWTQYAQRQAAIEKAFMPRFERAMGKQFDTFASVVKSDGLDNARNHINTIVTGQSIREAIKKLYTYSGTSEASFVYGSLKEQHFKFRGFGFNDQWVQILQQYLGNIELLNTVSGITDTTKDRILNVIASGIEAGDSVDDIVAKLQSDEYTTGRARLIVRTESVAATNLGGMVGAMSTGIMYQKEWASALDHRVRGSKPKDRFSHLELNGTVLDMEIPYNNGENIRYPGDKKASPGNICNCRCYQNFIAKRDRNGRIMRYDGQPLPQDARPVSANVMGAGLLQTIMATILGRSVGLLVDGVLNE